jgi:hypothetical protein
MNFSMIALLSPHAIVPGLRLSRMVCSLCCSNVNLSGVNGNVIMSWWKDDNPDHANEKRLDVIQRVYRGELTVMASATTRSARCYATLSPMASISYPTCTCARRSASGFWATTKCALSAGGAITTAARRCALRALDWYKGGIYTMWWEHQLRQAGLHPERDVEWKIGYLYGSMREAWKRLQRAETDAAIVQNPWVPMLLEQGYNKLYDFDHETKSYGRSDRVTAARKSFTEPN